MTAKGIWIYFPALLLVNLILAERCIPGSYEPYPEQCDKYLRCEYGILREKYCPSGLHWNDKYKNCDLPEYSNCAYNKGIRECNFGEYRRNSEDCSSFYQCVNGILVSFKCPHELHWNEKYATCDKPENAGCAVSSYKYKSTKQCKNGEYLADTTNCNNFLQCTNGILMSMPCPSGLHWNRELKLCDWPEFANCNILSDPESETTLLQTESCEHDNYIDNPTNCNSFFQCVYGIPIEMPCPAGLHWNKFAKICDWPENAQCKIQVTTTESVTENYSESLRKCKHGEYLPNLEDCNSFIQCVHGSPVYQSCPTGLHWNKLETVCDWPEAANCIVESTVSETIMDITTESNTNDVTESLSTTVEISTSELITNPALETEASTVREFVQESSTHLIGTSTAELVPEPSTSISELTEINTITEPDEPTLGFETSDISELSTITTNSESTSEGFYSTEIITDPSTEPEPITANSEISEMTLGEQSTTESVVTPDSEPEPTTENPELGKTNTQQIVTDPSPEPEPTTHVSEIIQTTFGDQPTTESTIIPDPEPESTTVNLESTVSNTKEIYTPEIATDPSLEPEPTTPGIEISETTLEELSTTDSNTPVTEQETTLEALNLTVSEIPEPDPTTVNPSSDGTGEAMSTISSTILSDPSSLEVGSTADDQNIGSTDVATTALDTEIEFSTIISTEATKVISTEPSEEITEGETISITTTESLTTHCIHEELLPNPNNCNSFLQCVHGNPVEMPCPTGLHWNNEMKLCDWPENTQCNTEAIISTMTTKEITLSTNVHIEIIPENFTTTSNTELEGTIGTTIQIPTENIISSTSFTKITETTSFSKSEQNEMSTEEITTSIAPEIEKTSTISITTTETSSITCIHDELLPNPRNCNSFLQCVHGTPIEMSCPKGLHWNNVSKICDWPENTICDIDSEVNDTITEEPSTSTKIRVESNETISEEVIDTSTKSTEDMTTENSEDTEEKESNETEEISKPCTHGEYLPNTIDCGSFYQCVHDKPVLVPCPTGLHWNIEAKVCDWPQSANCKFN